MKILLGSNSPRRRELLNQMGIDFERVKIDCDENFSATMARQGVAEYLAIKKSKAYKALSQNELLITADTTVVLGDQILNKPVDAAEAKGMLLSLKGRSHQVVTGVCLRTSARTDSFSVVTTVYVDSLLPEEIEYYVNKYRPMDKAGAYGIQEWFGLTQVSRVDGCYYNVVGLPCNEVFKRLKRFQ